MATPGYAALYRVPGSSKTGSEDKPLSTITGETKAPTMGLQAPQVPSSVQNPGQPQRLFDQSRARYAAGGIAGLEEKVFSIKDDPGYRAYDDGGMVIPELQTVQDEGMPIDMIEEQNEEAEAVAETDKMLENAQAVLNEAEEPDIDELDNEDLQVSIDTTMLTAEDEQVLEQAIETFPALLDIIPKMFIANATNEFSGEGEVDGPGTETSDSIPARLSDGEFVFTAKSVNHLGVDKLRKMMKKAEDDYDKDMNIQDEQQMDTTPMDIVPTDVMSAARGGLMQNPYK